MAHTYTDLLYHCVFSTKERRPLIDSDLWPELTRVIGGIIRDRKGRLLECNGMPDHVHLLAAFHPTISVADMLQAIKAGSTNWVHSLPGQRAFSWQKNYSCFTVGIGNKNAVVNYIRRQQARHQKTTFEVEFIELLQRAGTPYNPQHVFG